MTSGQRRVHVMISGDLLREVDERVGRRRRSEFIREAAAEKLNRLRRVEAFERAVGSVADGDNPDWKTRESTAEWLRAHRVERHHQGSPPPGSS